MRFVALKAMQMQDTDKNKAWRKCLNWCPNFEIDLGENIMKYSLVWSCNPDRRACWMWRARRTRTSWRGWRSAVWGWKDRWSTCQRQRTSFFFAHPGKTTIHLTGERRRPSVLSETLILHAHADTRFHQKNNKKTELFLPAPEIAFFYRWVWTCLFEQRMDQFTICKDLTHMSAFKGRAGAHIPWFVCGFLYKNEL